MMPLQEFTESFLKAFLAQSPVIIPSLVAFLFASPASLRFRLAAQSAPRLEISEDELENLKPKSSISRKTFLAGLALFIFCFGAFFSVFRSNGRATAVIDAFGASTFFPISVVSIINLVGSIIGYPCRSVHRNAAGLPTVEIYNRGGRCLEVLGALLVSLGVGISTTAFATENVVCNAIVFAALIYTVYGGQILAVKSIRRIMVLCITCAGVLLLIVARIAVYKMSSAASKPIVNEPASASLEFSDSLLLRTMMWSNWLLSVWFGVASTLFMSICLRFDYAIHVAAWPEEDMMARLTFETVPAPSSKPELGSGIVIPAVLPVKFSKPYYFATLMSWIIANAVVLSVIAVYDLRVVSGYGIAMTLIAMPIMCLGVVSMSVLRGETRKMWAYYETVAEDWAVRPIIAEPATVYKDEEPEKPLVELEENAEQFA